MVGAGDENPPRSDSRQSPADPRTDKAIAPKKTFDANCESRALKRSLVGYLTFGALGVTFAVITGSDAILLDGVYSLICAAVAVGALHVSRLVLLPDDESHPFGYAKYEPLLNILKGLLILAVCVLSAAGSLAALFFGGREPAFGVAIFYSVTCTAGCLAMAVIQRRSAQESGSALLKVEARSWVVDAAITAAVGLAFLAALIMDKSPLSELVPFIDPMVTLGLVMVLLPVPAITVLEGLGQLLFVCPERGEGERLRTLCLDKLEALGPAKPRLRLTRVGRTVYVLVTMLLGEDDPDPTVESLDRARLEIEEGIRTSGIAPVAIVEIMPTRREALM